MAHKCSFCYFEKYVFEVSKLYMDSYGGIKVQTDILMLKNWHFGANFSQNMHQD